MKKEIRKVLVVNAGSSSLKYMLFDMKGEKMLCKGLVERIGIPGSRLVFEQVDNQRAVLAPDFKLQLFQIVADVFQVLYGQVEKSVILEELIVVIYLCGDEVAFPILVDVIGDGILQGNHQVHVFALDGDHELVGRAETLVRLLKGLYAGSVFGQQVGKVGVKLESRLE